MVTKGRSVYVTLSESMVAQIRTVRLASGTPGFHGNAPEVGDEYAAVVVWVIPNNPSSMVNLQVFTDGNHTMWFTSVPHSVEPKPGCWHWPPRVGG